MTAGAPWSVKGIDPEAREIAKDLARRSGMSLNDWINELIAEDDGTIPASRPVIEDPLFIETPRRDAPSRYEAVRHPADEVGKVADAIERLTARIEAAEQRSTLAITGIDQSVRGALARLEGSEREQISVAARFEGAVEELRTDHQRTQDRLARIEAEAAGPRSAEALRALEGSIGKVAGQLFETDQRTRDILGGLEARIASVEMTAPTAGPDATELAQSVAEKVLDRLEAAEKQTSSAIYDLGSSFVKLDGRLRRMEGADQAAPLKTLAASLNVRLEATRREMAENLRAATDGRFDRVESKIGEMTAHVQAAEQRSALAIERMGREMVSMADNLSRRVQTVEGRSAQAVEQVGSEVSRIAGLVEQRLAHTDGSQAQALEKLGAEIARITERLSERIANSERRSAQAIDDVGEQVARVSERLSQRQERVSTDLSDRIRQSEERTARLLDEAREKIDATLVSATRRLAEQVAPAAAPVMASGRRPDAGSTLFGPDPFGSDPFSGRDSAIPEEAFESSPFQEGPFQPQAFSAVMTAPPAALAHGAGPDLMSEADYEAAEALTSAAGDRPRDSDESPLAFEPEPGRLQSTREVIEQARAAARLSGQPESRGAKSGAGRNLFGGRPPESRRKAGAALQTTLGVVGLLACGSIALTGYIISQSGRDGGEVDRIARALEIRKADEAEIKSAEAQSLAVDAVDPRVAMAISPGAGSDPAIAAPPPAAAAAPAAVGDRAISTLYADGVRRLEARDPAGLESLRKAANQGYAPAQFYLAKLYENGESGLSKDLPAARRWTERAAQGGERKAMHNLGLYFFEGTGGAKNLTTAAQWFRRAADLGLTDSQYNLGKLYEEGFGVTQNGAEAYKWYLIAARAGDSEAKGSADRIRSALSADSRAGAERAAAGYRAAAPNPSTQAALSGGPSDSLAQAQKALSRLGYYQGPQDGSPSAALAGAIRAYQRDQSLSPTGQLDAATVARLSPYTR
jgi:localization factor PodJL